MNELLVNAEAPVAPASDGRDAAAAAEEEEGAAAEPALTTRGAVVRGELALCAHVAARAKNGYMAWAHRGWAAELVQQRRPRAPTTSSSRAADDDDAVARGDDRGGGDDDDACERDAAERELGWTCTWLRTHVSEHCAAHHAARTAARAAVAAAATTTATSDGDAIVDDARARVRVLASGEDGGGGAGHEARVVVAFCRCCCCVVHTHLSFVGMSERVWWSRWRPISPNSRDWSPHPSGESRPSPHLSPDLPSPAIYRCIPGGVRERHRCLHPIIVLFRSSSFTTPFTVRSDSPPPSVRPTPHHTAAIHSRPPDALFFVARTTACA